MRADGRRLQARIDDHAQRLAGGGDEPHVEPRIVVEHRADAGEQGAGALAPGVAVGARRVAGDPLADAVVERAAAVERDRGLEPQPGPTALHARDEADVELAGFLFARTDDDLDAGGGETRGTLAGDQRIRIAHRHHHPADTGGDERLGAGRRAAVVRAGLEADDDGGAAHIDTAARGVAQRHHLGMRATRFLGVAAADDTAAAVDDDAADPRIGIGEAHRLLRKRERLAHGFSEGAWIGSGRRRVVQGVCRVGSGLMWQRAEAGRKQARFARGRAGLLAAHDQEILRQERAGDVDIVQRMLDVRIDRAGAVAVRDVAADAAVAAAVADRPARGQDRAPPRPAAVGSGRDDAAVGDVAVAGIQPREQAERGRQGIERTVEIRNPTVTIPCRGPRGSAGGPPLGARGASGGAAPSGRSQMSWISWRNSSTSSKLR